MSEQPAKTKAQLHNPDFFQSKTVAGRYSEWADDGVVSSIKSRLVPTNRGMGLPRAGHTRRASNNLRRKRNLPEAIDKLIERGLTRPAALDRLVILGPNSWEREERLFRTLNWHLSEKWREQQTC